MSQNQRWDGEGADTEVKQGILGIQTFLTLPQSMSAAKNMSEQLSPCSSGKSASSEPGSTWNKGLMSCLRAISSRAQPAELAKTLKIPHRGKASPLASRWNKVQPAQYNKTHRSEHAKDGVLNRSTHEEASKQTQNQNIMNSKNMMKQLYNRTNIETVDSECPSSGGILGGTTTIPHFLTLDVLSSESEENEDDQDLLRSWQNTFLKRDLIAFPKTVSPSVSASTSFSHSLHSLQPVGGLPTVLEQQGESHMATPNTDSFIRSIVARTQWTDQHRLKLKSSWQTSQTSLASPSRTSFSQRQSTLVNMEEGAVQKGASTTEDTLQCPNKAWDQRTSRQLDNLNVDGVMTLSDGKELEHIHECQLAQGGATAAQDPLSLKDSKRELVCRPKQRLLDELSNEEDGQCRICHSGDSSPTNPLLTPCLCSGSLRFIHLDCLKKWIETRVQLGSRRYVVQRCELCMGRLKLNPDIFDWDEYFPIQHQQQQEDDITEQYHVREALVDRALTFTTLPSSSLLRALVTSTNPAFRTQILPLLPDLIRMRQRRLRERRNLSLAISDT